MAQLVERLVRNEEASGSNPLISTTKKDRLTCLFFVYKVIKADSNESVKKKVDANGTATKKGRT